MIDLYYRRPVFWDYVISCLICVGLAILWKKGFITIPQKENLYSLISDLATIALTLAGFILTFLTVLISFKSSDKQKDLNSQENSAFEVFFSSEFYFVTVRHLNNAIKSLTLLSVAGYLLKLFVEQVLPGVLFFYDVFGIIVIFFTVWRCLAILSRIIKIQQDN